MVINGVNLYICGYSNSLGSSTSNDAFVLSVKKSSGDTNWVRIFGTASAEISYGLAVNPLTSDIFVTSTTNNV